MNKNVYQTPAGLQQLQSTRRLLSEISSNTHNGSSKKGKLFHAS